MAGYGAIVDDRLLASLGSHFGDLCTVQRLTETTDEYGQVVEAWADLYVGLPCNVMPAKKQGLAGEVVGAAGQTYAVANYSIALQGAYPDIRESDRAIVGGVAYNILLASTTLGAMTTLACEVVR